MLRVAKRILRGVVKVVATVAGVVFFFDNKLGGTGGIVLLGSIAVLFVCLFVWVIFELGEDSGLGPDEPRQ
jgi:anaerobic C4-dicarboxylate transporter